ncbi:DNA cytosine methyltransferase [Candidatus Kaiserbacteria bacterium]|nr:DNA cytosine methyltransferase [Candidatus Kaiserbacteria bacterium]MCB9811323.1 DNA cytosine methyltransferase [Candidatus Nomurabacteria bacterium]
MRADDIIKRSIKTPSLFSGAAKESMGDFKIIDLFAGIGGIRLGFEQHGGESVFSSEWDKHAQTTYQANFDEIPYGDITQIEPEEIPAFDVLLGGFPCQPFSQAGLKKGFADTRGTLFFDVARIVNHHRPRVVFLENVKRFKTHDKGNTFNVVKTVLEEMGYEVHAKVLNARDFGVPQNRERIYIVAFLGKTNFEFPEPLGVQTRVGNILEKNVDDKYTISDKLWAGHQRRKKEHAEKGYGFGYSMFNDDSVYTSTISARYYKDGSEILIEQKGKNPRKLTPREAARLQGYPDDFVIPVSDAQAYKQFGNSVAVPVINAIAKNVVKELRDLKRAPKKAKLIDLDSIKDLHVKAAEASLVTLNN